MAELLPSGGDARGATSVPKAPARRSRWSPEADLPTAAGVPQRCPRLSHPLTQVTMDFPPSQLAERAGPRFTPPGRPTRNDPPARSARHRETGGMQRARDPEAMPRGWFVIEGKVPRFSG